MLEIKLSLKKSASTYIFNLLCYCLQNRFFVGELYFPADIITLNLERKHKYDYHFPATSVVVYYPFTAVIKFSISPHSACPFLPINPIAHRKWRKRGPEALWRSLNKFKIPWRLLVAICHSSRPSGMLVGTFIEWWKAKMYLLPELHHAKVLLWKLLNISRKWTVQQSLKNVSIKIKCSRCMNKCVDKTGMYFDKLDFGLFKEELLAHNYESKY